MELFDNKLLVLALFFLAFFVVYKILHSDNETENMELTLAPEDQVVTTSEPITTSFNIPEDVNTVTTTQVPVTTPFSMPDLETTTMAPVTTEYSMPDLTTFAPTTTFEPTTTTFAPTTTFEPTTTTFAPTTTFEPTTTTFAPTTTFEPTTTTFAPTTTFEPTTTTFEPTTTTFAPTTTFVPTFEPTGAPLTTQAEIAPQPYEMDYLKDQRLNAYDLLPKKDSEDIYADLKPDSKLNQNFLQNRWSLGIDVSKPKRGFINDLRGAPANPTPLTMVSPFQQPTQFPDLYRKTLGEVS